jgi:hypothetical protein
MVVKLDVQKVRNGQYWTNRYLLDLADPLDVSVAMVNAFVNAEKPIHGLSVSFVSVRVSDMAEGTDNFIIYPQTGTGGTSDGGAALPGWMTLRADMAVVPGRPLRKYYRTYVGEAQIIGSVWLPQYVSDSLALLTTLLGAVPTWCDPQGNHAQSVVVKTDVQMRQLRRGSKKRETPVIPIA